MSTDSSDVNLLGILQGEDIGADSKGLAGRTGRMCEGPEGYPCHLAIEGGFWDRPSPLPRKK